MHWRRTNTVIFHFKKKTRISFGYKFNYCASFPCVLARSAQLKNTSILKEGSKCWDKERRFQYIWKKFETSVKYEQKQDPDISLLSMELVWRHLCAVNMDQISGFNLVAMQWLYLRRSPYFWHWMNHIPKIRVLRVRRLNSKLVHFIQHGKSYLKGYFQYCLLVCCRLILLRLQESYSLS